MKFKPRRIKIEPTKEKLTNASGLGTLIEVFDQSWLKKPFTEALPKRTSPRSAGSYRLGLIQLSSFIYGHDCLDDLEEFRNDPTVEAVMRGESAAPRTMGDFLRDAEDNNLEALNNFLPLQAQSYRENLIAALPEGKKPSKAPHLSIDSAVSPEIRPVRTSSVQC